jgi:hypothetical protein
MDRMVKKNGDEDEDEELNAGEPAAQPESDISEARISINRSAIESLAPFADLQRSIAAFDFDAVRALRHPYGVYVPYQEFHFVVKNSNPAATPVLVGCRRARRRR